MHPESPIYQEQQRSGSESVSLCIRAMRGGSECSFLSIGHTPFPRESVGKCPKTARACSAYLTDPLYQGALSCDVPAKNLSFRGKSQQEPLKLVAGEQGSMEAEVGDHATHPWPRMLSPDQGPASRAWPRATEAKRPSRGTAPQTPRLPSTKLSPHRLAGSPGSPATRSEQLHALKVTLAAAPWRQLVRGRGSVVLKEPRSLTGASLTPPAYSPPTRACAACGP